MNTSLMAYIGGGLFGLVAIILALVSYSEWKSQSAWLDSATLTEGTVVRLEEKGSTFVDSSQAPQNQNHPASTTELTAQYQVGSHMHTLKESSSLLGWWYQVGDRVPVYYSNEDPSDGHLDLFLVLWGTVVATGVVSLMFVAGAVLIVRVMT